MVSCSRDFDLEADLNFIYLVATYSSIERSIGEATNNWSPEDVMRKAMTASIAVVLVLLITCLSFAFETDFDDLKRFDRSLPSWKLGRGVVNVVSGPYELYANIVDSMINGSYVGAYDGALQGYLAGAGNGFIAGAVNGIYLGVRRTAVGAMEILTFWKPEFGPTIEPLYGTRDKSFAGPQDYFDPDPWWFNGPMR